MEIDRAVFFHEQFFDERDTNEHFHEISIYYLMKITEKIKDIICNSFTEKLIAMRKSNNGMTTLKMVPFIRLCI